MKAHIFLAHPEPQSFNGQLAKLSRQSVEEAGGTATLSDLYQMGFDPSEGAVHYNLRKDEARFHVQTEQRFNAEQGALPPEVLAEVERIEASDLLIVHFPLWWFGMPAILKGWMDRVFVYGRMYRSLARYDKGVCAGKRMIACVTTRASADNCAFNGREEDTRLHLWPILLPFRYLCFSVHEPQIFHGVGGVAFMEGNEDGLSTIDVCSRQWSEALTTLSDRRFVPYNRDEDFDPETKHLLPSAPSYSPFVRQEE